MDGLSLEPPTSRVRIEREGNEMVVRLRPRLAYDLVLFVCTTLPALVAAAFHALGVPLGVRGVEILLILVLGFVILGARRLLLPLTLRLGERGLALERGVLFRRTRDVPLREARRARAEPVVSLWGGWSCAIRGAGGEITLASWLDEKEAKWLAFLINKYLRAAKEGTSPRWAEG